jgi:outer membrane immunogenic protein
MRTRLLSLLAGTAAAALLASAAQAADLSARAAPPPPIAAVPIFTWTGFYVGANIGGGWLTNSERTVFDPVTGTFIDIGGNNTSGVVGGGQIGYNYQFGSVVVGLEADIQGADLRRSRNRNEFLFATPAFIAANERGVEWFGTVRARLGYAFDRVLIYATGGFAYGGGGGNGRCLVDGVFFDCGGDNTNTGWTAGGGVEWALPYNWFGSSAVTFGVEGLFVSLERNRNNDFFLFDGAFDNGRRDLEFGVVRAKLNFKF